MKNEFHLLIRNNVSELIKSVKAVNTFLEAHGLSSRIVYNVNLVFEEILTNIMKYAFQDDWDHEIQVLFVLQDVDIVLEFVDDGQEFNPLSVPPPEMRESILDSAAGGLGIHLVKQVVERIEYRRERDRNILRMNINLAAEAQRRLKLAT
ncbi:MAG: ATP-binding protein [Desulfomonile sp.]